MPETDEHRIAKIEFEMWEDLEPGWIEDIHWLVSKIREQPSLPRGFTADAVLGVARLLDKLGEGEVAIIVHKWATHFSRDEAYRAALSEPQVRPEQANAQQSGAADDSGEGEL